MTPQKTEHDLLVEAYKDKKINWFGKYPQGWAVGIDSASGQSTSVPVHFGKVEEYLMGRV